MRNRCLSRSTHLASRCAAACALATLAFAAHAADQPACTKRTADFANIDLITSLVGKCTRADVMGEDRLGDCGSHMTQVVQSDGRDVFMFNLGAGKHVSFISTPTADGLRGGEMHFVVQKLFISGKDAAVNPVSTTLKEPGACAIKVGMSPAFVISCHASVNGQAFSFAFAAQENPDIVQVCRKERALP